MNTSSETRFRAVQLTHLSPSSSSSTPQFPRPSTVRPKSSLSTSHTGRKETDLLSPSDPFSILPETVDLIHANRGNGKYDVDESYQAQCMNNLQKWRQFGLDTSKYGMSLPDAATTSQSAAIVPHASSQRVPLSTDTVGRRAKDHPVHPKSEVSYLIMDDPNALHPSLENKNHHSRAEEADAGRTHTSDAKKLLVLSDEDESSEAAPVATSSGASALFTSLSRNLFELSERVQRAVEKGRCGSPKKSLRSTSFSGGSRSRKKHKPDDRTGEGKIQTQTSEKLEASSPRAEVGSGKAPGLQTPSSSRGTKSKRTTAKLTHRKEKNETSPPIPSELNPPPVSKTAGGGNNNNNNKNHKSRRTLRGPQEPFGLTETTPSGNEIFHEEAPAPIPTVPFERLSRTVDLFLSLQAALKDPDRIQVPPLYVGLLFDLGKGRTQSNISLSASPRSRASILPFVDSPERWSKHTAVVPSQAHHFVRDVVLRWKDKAYVLEAKSIGMEFLLRVLRELVGVELITFNAPALLLPLLSYSQNVLATSCVSDVRVMAWMLSLSDANSEFTQDGNTISDYYALIRNCRFDSSSSSSWRSPASFGETSVTLQGLANEVFWLAPVHRALYGQLGSRGLLQAFLRQEKRISIVIARMKRAGMLVDLKRLRQFKTTCCEEMKKWQQLAGEVVQPHLADFNIQSPDQCRQVLFEVLDLGRYLLSGEKSSALGDSPPPQRAGSPAAPAPSLSRTLTKGGKLSTAEETLRVLADHHPFPGYLIHYRKAAKILQTYVDGLLPFLHPPPLSRVPGEPAAHGGERDGVTAPATATVMDLFVDDALSDRVAMGGRGNGDTPSQSPSPSRSAADRRVSTPVRSPTTRRGSATRPPFPLEDLDYAVVYPNFIHEGTDTGRLSCVEPNLQNLPRAVVSRDAAESGGDEMERDVRFRSCFVAPPGWVLLAADYEQIELRVLAHLCGDETLIDTLANATDIHQAIAKVIFRKPVISSEERNLAKRVVFGMLYGASPRTLAAQMSVDVERALNVLGLLKTYFPHMQEYQQRVVEQGRVDGFVRMISGRVRALPDLNSSVLAKRTYAERQAFNTVVQGSAADVMKMSMLAVEKEVLQVYVNDVQLVSQIHDEMVFSVKEEKLREVVPRITTAMAHAMSLLVPICVNVKIGPSLAEMKPWSIDHELGIQ